MYVTRAHSWLREQTLTGPCNTSSKIGASITSFDTKVAVGAVKNKFFPGGTSKITPRKYMPRSETKVTSAASSATRIIYHRNRQYGVAPDAREGCGGGAREWIIM